MMLTYSRGWIVRGVWLVVLASLLVIGRAGGEEVGSYREAIHDPLRRQQSQVLEEKADPVYDVYGDYVIRGPKVHNASLKAMLNTGIKKLAGVNDASAGWRQFLHEDDVIALKFSEIGNETLGTNQEFVTALLQCLYEAGFKAEQIMVVGLDSLPDAAQGTRPCRYGWQKEKVNFGSDSECLAEWLNEVTAIINIPSVLDDNLIGLNGALANMAWSMVKSPARFYQYRTGGDPFIPEIYNLPQIRGKIRLHIANALRILYYGGPIVRQHNTYEYGAAIFSTDPVALDLVMMKLLNRVRREHELPSGAPENVTATYLQTAQDLGLGYCDLNFVDYKHLPHEKWLIKDKPDEGKAAEKK